MGFESSIELAKLSPRAREAFHGLVDGLADGNFNVEAFGQGLVWFNNLTDDEICDVVAEVLKQREWQARASAALMYCKCTATYPPINQKQRNLLRDAEQVIAEILAKPQDDEALCIVCNMMGRMGVVPASVVPSLESLIEQENKLKAAYAAVALCSVPDKVPVALPVLHKLLRSDDDQAKLIAAPVMALNDYQIDAAMSALVEVLPQSRWEDRCGVVRHIETIGPKAIRMLPILEQMLADETLPSFFRARAATAIGSVTKGTKSHLKLLSETLSSADWEIMDGAADGLEVHGGFRDSDIDRIAAHLDAESRDMRRIAAIALKRFGSRASRAIPKLIERFRNEPDPQLCLGLTEAVAAMGVDAVAPLIEAAKQQDFRIISLIAATLRAIGDHAVVPVVEQLVQDPNEQIRILGIVILKEMGTKAAPAIPTLAEMIEDTLDLELVCTVAAIFALCGRDSAIAARSLVRALIRCDDAEFTHIATGALRKVGPIALEALAEASALAFLSAEDKRRIDTAIAACQPQLSERFKHLQQLNSDDLLRYFVLAAQLLANQKQVGWGEVGERIAPLLNFVRANGRPFGTAGNSVRDIFADLKDRLKSGPLTTHRPKVSGTLTEQGELLLKDASEYLRQKYGPDFLPAANG